MKSLNLKSIVQLVAFAGILTTGANAQFLPGQTLANNAHSLVGTWKVTVSPDGMPPFQAYNVFTVDGNSFEFDNSNPPASQTIAVGPWTSTDVNSYAFTEINQLFDNTGAYVGELKVRGTIALTGNGDTYTGPFKFDVPDPNGNSVFSGTGTAVGKRVVVEGR